MIDAPTPSQRAMLHELKQPLNVITLSSGNIRSRMMDGIDAELAHYLAAKLDRIEEQAQRAASLIEAMLAGPVAPATGQGTD
jgi:signal transduction histidine kinase